MRSSLHQRTDGCAQRTMVRFHAATLMTLLMLACGGSDPADTYTVTATAGAGGSITPATQDVNDGDTATLTVTANEGYDIAGVAGCDGSLAGTTYTTGRITADCSVEATFAIRSYTVTAMAGAGGSVDPETQQVDHGMTATITLTPDAGFGVASAMGCGGSLDGTSFSTAAVTADCEVTASFGEIPAAPTDLVAEAGNAEMTLTWSDVTGADSYRLYHATEAGLDPATFASLAGGTQVTDVTSPYTVTGLTNDTTYYAVVTAVVGGIESAPSNEVSATPSDAPPTFAEVAQLITTDIEEDSRLGSSVAIQGNLVVVGAQRHDGETANSGAAYVYELDAPTGTLTEIAKLEQSSAVLVSSDYFGSSVAIDGDTIVVGARHERFNGAGRAYVFVRPSAGWAGTLNEDAILAASDRAAGDYFGDSVAIDGDTVVVGARGEDDLGPQAGALYVFQRPSGGWAGSLAEDAKLVTSERPGNAGYLGRSVAIEDDLIVAAAHLGEVDGQDQAGRGFVYVRPGGGWTGTLTETAELNVTEDSGNDRLGFSVAISNGVIVMGAPLWEPVGETNDNRGRALIFEEPMGGWTGLINETAQLVGSTRGSQEQMGYEVAIDGDTVVVGSESFDRVRIFHRPAGGWSGEVLETQILEEMVDGDDNFGFEVALDGDYLLVAAADDDTEAVNAGRVYLYQLEP